MSKIFESVDLLYEALQKIDDVFGEGEGAEVQAIILDAIEKITATDEYRNHLMARVNGDEIK